MPKTKLAFILVLLVSMLAVVLAYIAYDDSRQDEEESAVGSYAEQHTYRYGLGQTATLDSEADAEGKAYGWTGHFGWDGTLKATVVSAAALSPDDPSLKGKLDKESQDSFIEDLVDEEGWFGNADELVVLSLVFEFENVDAKTNKGDYAFNVGSFQPQFVDSCGDLLAYDCAFFDESKDPDGKAVNRFMLKKGKKKQLHVGWFDTTSHLKGGLIIRICESEKYQFVISPSDIEGLSL